MFGHLTLSSFLPVIHTLLHTAPKECVFQKIDRDETR